jgi:hypothetical protein
MADVAFSIPNSRSLLLDGAGDYLFTTPIPFTSDGIFTIECWFKTTSTSQQGLFFCGDPASNNRRVQLEITSTGQIGFYVQVTTANQSIYSEAGLININTWYHVAVVRTTQVYVVYLNGIMVSAALISVTVATDNPNNLHIGFGRSGGIVRYLNGYISNFRVVNGTFNDPGSFVYGRAGDNFIPPTQPLYLIENTTLLTCQSPTIIDKSYNPLPITVFGNARVDDENPFGFSTSTPAVISVNAFNITSTNLVMNEAGRRARQNFDIYELQSGIDLPVTVGITDGIFNVASNIKSKIEIPQLQSPVTLIPSISASTQRITSFSTIITRSSVRAFTAVPTDLFLSNNISSDLTTFATSITPVIVKRSRAEKTSPLKVSTARTLQTNTLTNNYSYWV